MLKLEDAIDEIMMFLRTKSICAFVVYQSFNMEHISIIMQNRISYYNLNMYIK